MIKCGRWRPARGLLILQKCALDDTRATKDSMGYAGYKNNVRTLIDGFPPPRAVLSMTKGDRVCSHQ